MLDWIKGLDSAQITALVGALVALITAFSTKGVNAYIRLMTYLEERRARAIDLECDEQQIEKKDLKYILRYQERRIDTLESECKSLREENLLCAEDRARLQAELTQVTAQFLKEVARLEAKVKDLAERSTVMKTAAKPSSGSSSS